MNISFKELPPGLYTEEILKKQWPGVLKTRGVNEGRCEIVELDGEHVLQVTALKGKVGPQDGGVSFRSRFGESLDEYIAEYKVRVPKDFEYVRGGKLPGLCGGSNPQGGASTAKADGFSARVMWRESGTLEQYVYYMDKEAQSQWGKDFLWTTGKNKQVTITPDMWKSLGTRTDERCYLTSDVWHTVKTYIKMNTPEKEDGKIITWLDGQEVLNLDLRFRKNGSFAIDSFQFAVYFGGNEESWSPRKDEKIYLKDFSFHS